MDFKERYKYNPKTDLLGKGGFSETFKAYDELLKREVALKFFKAQTEEKYGLIAEIRRAINLRHPNIVQYYDVEKVQFQGVHGLEMLNVGVLEYVNSKDLYNFLGTKPADNILKEVIIGILKGLQFIHNNNIIHRDIKPQNILMNYENGRWFPKISDFGISKQIGQDSAASAQLLGTVEYMAPEQFNSEKFGIAGKINTNVDLWAFGVILFEIFSGAPYFGKRSNAITTQQIMNNILKDFDRDKLNEVREPYRTVVNLCLVPDAKKRANSATELINILEGKSPVSSPVFPKAPTASAGGKPGKPVSQDVVKTPSPKSDSSASAKAPDLKWRKTGDVQVSTPVQPQKKISDVSQKAAVAQRNIAQPQQAAESAVKRKMAPYILIPVMALVLIGGGIASYFYFFKRMAKPTVAAVAVPAVAVPQLPAAAAPKVESVPESSAPEVKKVSDEDAFKSAKGENTLEAYRAYISDFPQGKFKQEASDSAEHLTYVHAEQKQTEEAFKQYLSSYPEGILANEARMWLDGEQAFRNARRTNSIESYQKYLADFPNGRHVQEVNNYIELKTQAETTEKEKKSRRFTDRQSNEFEYTGPRENGKPQGFGTAKFDNGDEYGGYFKNGQREGEGIYKKYGSGMTYDGDWAKDELIKGEQTAASGKVKYDGQFLNWKYQGQGKLFNSDNEWYEGEFRNGKITGQGEYHYENGDVYKGDFVDGQKHGKGVYTSVKGTKYDGAYRNDRREGYGIYSFKNGDRYEGNYSNDKRSGKGTYYLNNGSRYTGTWVDTDSRDGVLIDADGVEQKGKWINNSFEPDE